MNNNQEDAKHFKLVQDEPSGQDALPSPKKKTKRPKHWRFFTELELLVLKCVKKEIISAQEIANLMEIENNSTLRATLSSMTERMIIIRAKGGYRINR
jgi:predicted transcriptional regulator of viral defense system